MPITKTSWQKGRSGNPRGRHRSGEELAGLLRQIVDRRRFADKLCELCYAGDVQAMRLLLSYTDGPPQTGGPIHDPEAIQITVTYVQQNHIRIDGATPGANDHNPGVPAVQRSLLRPPLGQDRAGDGSAGSGGAAG
jgi:hypothetical protein